MPELSMKCIIYIFIGGHSVVQHNLRMLEEDKQGKAEESGFQVWRGRSKCSFILKENSVWLKTCFLLWFLDFYSRRYTLASKKAGSIPFFLFAFSPFNPIQARGHFVPPTPKSQHIFKTPWSYCFVTFLSMHFPFRKAQFHQSVLTYVAMATMQLSAYV